MSTTTKLACGECGANDKFYAVFNVTVPIGVDGMQLPTLNFDNIYHIYCSDCDWEMEVQDYLEMI